MATVSNSPAQHTVLRVETRKSFELGLWFMDQSGRPADLTSCVVRLVFEGVSRSGPQPVGAVSSHDALLVEATSGHCVIPLQAENLDLAEGEYPFVIVLITSEGFSSAVVKGTLDVRENSDSSALESRYGDVSQAPQALEVVLRGTSAIHVSLGPVMPPGFSWLSPADREKLDGLDLAGRLLPTGGNPGNLLGKRTAADYDFHWINPQAYDGTLSADGIPAGRAPVSDGVGGWDWGEVTPSVDWALEEGLPGSVRNKPAIGALAGYDALPEHEHAGEEITSGLVAKDFLPRLSEHRGVSWGTADPAGGDDGDVYYKYVP